MSGTTSTTQNTVTILLSLMGFFRSIYRSRAQNLRVRSYFPNLELRGMMITQRMSVTKVKYVSYHMLAYTMLFPSV